MRIGAGSMPGGLNWLFDDHLGSATITVDGATGAKVSELRYKPWGEIRYAYKPTMTDLRFTGQRAEGTGLYDYGARWYDPVLGRFVQADSVVASMGDPQAWDRYAYVNNNPVRYLDPSGHRECESGQANNCGFMAPKTVTRARSLLKPYSVSLEGDWRLTDAYSAYIGITTIGQNLSTFTKQSPEKSITNQFGKLNFTMKPQEGTGWSCEAGASGFTCYGGFGSIDPQVVTHELGHTFAIRLSYQPYIDLGNAQITDELGNWVFGTHPGGQYERTLRGYKSGGPPYMYHGPDFWNDWNSNDGNLARNEDFADMWMNWNFNSFDYSPEINAAGIARYQWFQTNMAEWVR